MDSAGAGVVVLWNVMHGPCYRFCFLFILRDVWKGERGSSLLWYISLGMEVKIRLGAWSHLSARVCLVM